MRVTDVRGQALDRVEVGDTGRIMCQSPDPEIVIISVQGWSFYWNKSSLQHLTRH